VRGGESRWLDGDGGGGPRASVVPPFYSRPPAPRGAPAPTPAPVPARATRAAGAKRRPRRCQRRPRRCQRRPRRGKRRPRRCKAATARRCKAATAPLTAPVPRGRRGQNPWHPGRRADRRPARPAPRAHTPVGWAPCAGRARTHPPCGGCARARRGHRTARDRRALLRRVGRRRGGGLAGRPPLPRNGGGRMAGAACNPGPAPSRRFGGGREHRHAGPVCRRDSCPPDSGASGLRKERRHRSAATEIIPVIAVAPSHWVPRAHSCGSEWTVWQPRVSKRALQPDCHSGVIARAGPAEGSRLGCKSQDEGHVPSHSECRNGRPAHGAYDAPRAACRAVLPRRVRARTPMSGYHNVSVLLVKRV